MTLPETDNPYASPAGGGVAEPPSPFVRTRTWLAIIILTLTGGAGLVIGVGTVIGCVVRLFFPNPLSDWHVLLSCLMVSAMMLSAGTFLVRQAWSWRLTKSYVENVSVRSVE
jgi:hypothetical protein